MKLDDLTRYLRPLSNRIANLVGRGVVKAVDDSKKLQELQLELLPGEVRDELEHFQGYGFTSTPAVPDSDGAAEAVAVFVNGRRDHGLIIAVGDRRYRLKNLPHGEVAMYSKHGQTIVLKTNGDIEATPKVGQKFKVVGATELAGDVSVTGTLTASVDVVGGGVHLKTHIHGAGTLTSPSGTVTGTTGSP
jgi:phage gp45-like